jgi:hypothetical protein
MPAPSGIHLVPEKLFKIFYTKHLNYLKQAIIFEMYLFSSADSTPLLYADQAGNAIKPALPVSLF